MKRKESICVKFPCPQTLPQLHICGGNDSDGRVGVGMVVVLVLVVLAMVIVMAHGPQTLPRKHVCC
jgi:hypothetical protein